MCKMIKLIAADMDGTLLDSSHEINEEFWSVYEKLKEMGIIFSAASGRQYHNLRNKFQEIKDEIIFIAENGSYVVKNGEELFSQILGGNKVPEFIDLAREIDGVYPVLCGKKSAYIENDKPEFVTEVKKYYDSCELVEDLKEVKDDALKVALYDFNGSETNCYHAFKKYEEDYKVVISAKYWLDIMNKFANKGMAMRKVQEYLGITKDESMAFGDYLNDVELLENVEHSYAMENAHPEVKKISKHIAGSNNENGVVEAIKAKFDL